MKNKHEHRIDRGIEYPDNLVDVLNRIKFQFQEDIKKPVTYEQMRGIKYVLSHIPERESNIISLMFEDGHSLESVGKILGISRERVHVLYKRALDRMRNVYYWKYITDGYVDDCACGYEYDTATGKKILDVRQDICVLGLSNRAEKGLRSAGIDNILKFVRFSDYFRINGCGEKTIGEILEAKNKLENEFFIPSFSFTERVNNCNLPLEDKQLINDILFSKMSDEDIARL